jgi:DNA-binding transcriptional regulator YiaG
MSRCSKAAKKKFGDTPAYLRNPDVQAKPLLELGRTALLDGAPRLLRPHERRPARAASADGRRPPRHFPGGARLAVRPICPQRQAACARGRVHPLGIDFISHQEALDTSTAIGKAMFTIIAAMAELERSVTRERVVAGLDVREGARDQIGQAHRTADARFPRDEVVRLRDEEKLGWPEIARRLGVSQGTVARAY